MATTVVTRARAAAQNSKIRTADRAVSSTYRIRLGRNSNRRTASNSKPLSTTVHAESKSTATNRQCVSRVQRPPKKWSTAAVNGSDPSSSNNSSSKSESKWTSSDLSGGSFSAKSNDDRQRMSSTPFSGDLKSVGTNSVPQQTSSAHVNIQNRRARVARKKTKSLNLRFVPKARFDLVAYREGSLSPEIKEGQTQNGVSKKNSKRPSPNSLREARLRRFSQNLTCASARPFASYIGTPERSRSNSRVTPNGDEFLELQRARANVRVRLADIPTSRIARFARDGYVVDIVSSFIIRQLPMSKDTRTIATKYIRGGQTRIATSRSSNSSDNEIDPGNPWQQWAYVSRLSMADIGRDGRRRTLTCIDEAEEEQESWVVLLVPLREGQANSLREALLTRSAGGPEATRRRQSLGSEIASSVEVVTAR